jgi:hypothetical protein
MKPTQQLKNARAPRGRLWVVLALLFAQIPGLVPLLCAGVAWIDGEHRVQLGSGADGYHVVLHHDANAAPGTEYYYRHQHCLLSRTLVAFANPDSSKTPDHVLSFHNGSQTENLNQLKFLPETSVLVPQPSLLLVTDVTLRPETTALVRSQPPSFSRPPPSTAATSFISQTVLLI